MAKVSIVTVCYNNRDELERTLSSIGSQTSKDYELIIIDGGSTDGTVDVIKSHLSYISYWVSERDTGIYNAMNKGLAQCNGEWVFFLNSGDIFYSNAVLSNVRFDEAGDDVGGIYGRYKYYSRYDELLLNECKYPFFESEKQLRTMGFSHQSVFVRTTLAKKYPFDESFRLCADYNMMMKIWKAGYIFLRDETIISVCDGRGGASANNRFTQDKELARVCGCEYALKPMIRRNLKRMVRPFYRWYMYIKQNKSKK